MKQFLLLIDGPMGSGKTTVSDLLHKKIKNTAWIGLDRIKWFVSGFKRSKIQNEMTRRVVAAMVVEYLKQGVNVIVEQGLYLEHIRFFRRLAKKYKISFFLFELTAPKETLLSRIKDRMAQRAGLGIGRKPITMSRVLRNMKIHANKEKDSQVRLIDTVGLAPEQIAVNLLKEMKKG